MGVIVIICAKFEQPKKMPVQRRFVAKGMLDGFEFFARNVGFRSFADDQTDLFAPAETDRHALTDLDIEAAVEIIEQLVERYIECDFQDVL